jgi:hypothetical protein
MGSQLLVNPFFIMKYITVFVLLLLLLASNRVHAQSAYVNRIIEYHPAPGQFINTSGWGTPAKANTLIGGLNGGISLGGYGGYVVVGFDHRIENHADNPYGIDFTVFGNPLANGQLVTWSEAGAIMVMKDENDNGLADDTWYELAGSDYYFKSSIKNYQITYTNPAQTIAADVPWKDNQGRSGNVLKNEFHLQPYYPRHAVFPDVNPEEISFTGTLIKGYVDRSDASYIQSYRRGFGYTDNALAGAGAHTLPDNPYTSAIEGAGGDAFDIDWAVDGDGNHIYLDGIDFVKIYTALNSDAGWLGEVSTEIRGVVDVAPDAALTGELDAVVMADIPVSIQKNTSLELEAYAFRKGILQPGDEIVFSVDNIASAEISGNVLNTIAPGNVVVTAALKANPSIKYQLKTTVVASTEIIITAGSATIRVNGRTEIDATVLDQNKKELTGIDLTWESSNLEVLSLVQGEKTFVQGNSAGSAWVFVSGTHIPALKDSILITILPETSTRNVYIRIKDDAGTIIPRTRIAVGSFDLNGYVDRARGNYDINHVSTVTVAHAIALLFDNKDFESDLRFRDDDKGADKLYLWRVPRMDQSMLTYVYGDGGSTEAHFDEAWVVKVNDRSYVNDLHNVPIREDDEITVYHAGNAAFPWQLIQVHINKQVVTVNEKISLTVTRFEQMLNSDRTITTTSSDAVKDASLYVNGVLHPNETSPLVTDELGKLELSFSSTGVRELEIAGETLSVTVNAGGIPVGIEDETTSWAVYPNPFADYCIINDVTSGQYTIINSTGINALNGSLKGDTAIDTRSLMPGIYIVRISTRTSTRFVKIIKR